MLQYSSVMNIEYSGNCTSANQLNRLKSLNCSTASVLCAASIGITALTLSGCRYDDALKTIPKHFTSEMQELELW